MSKFIGIDPGKSTGIAICENGKLIDVFTVDFWGAIEAIATNEEAVVVVELPANKHVYHDKAKTKGAIQGTALRVGSVIREAELIIEYLHRNKRDYIIQRPQGKKTSEQFKRITKWEGITNQHERDSALLIHGLKEMQSTGR